MSAYNLPPLPLPPLDEIMEAVNSIPNSRRQAWERLAYLRSALAALLGLPEPRPIAESQAPPFAWLIRLVYEYQIAVLLVKRLQSEAGHPPAASTARPISAT